MSDPNKNVVPVLLPQAGNSMEEGTIVKWHVRPGDTVKAGQVLFELETDKATIEVEAETDGRLARIVLPEGGTAPVKTPVAYLADYDADLEAYLGASRGTVEPAGQPAPSVRRSVEATGTVAAPLSAVPSTRVKASPVARRAAQELGVDLEVIAPGSGPDGRVLLEDVQAAAKAVAASMPTLPANRGGVRTPMPKMRRAIARNLGLSKQTVPHWYATVTIEADDTLAYYKREKQLYPCSLNDVILQAVGRVVMEMPEFRTQVAGDDLVQFDSANIGLAVALESGLVVPVVKNVDKMNLKGIAAESRRVIEAARNGKLEGVGEGVFTISNLGMYGVEEFAAIINPPECGILAVGAVREEVIAKDGTMRVGKKMSVTLSADHRVIDGVTSAKFLARLKELLESPSLLG